MSNAVEVTPEAQASNAALVEANNAATKKRYIKRHSLQARITHGVTIIVCILLALSGLAVFCPPITRAVGPDVVLFCRMIHRVGGVIFVLVPLISAIASPKGVGHIVKNLFHPWDKDDIKWMLLFFPYLFGAKWIHMPDQGEVKSGQRFADGMLWIAGFIMAGTGIILLSGEYIFAFPAMLMKLALLGHDVGFFLIAVFGLAHIFLGAGIFQPYRGSHKLMFGDGLVSEADALYHWGHWAREELESGKNIVEK